MKKQSNPPPPENAKKPKAPPPPPPLGGVEILKIKMPMTLYDRAIENLEFGIEYAQDLLSERDTRFGRTTLSNRRMAEIIEKDIQTMSGVIQNLKDL